MKKSKFHINFEKALRNVFDSELNQKEFNELQFKLNPIEEIKGKNSSKDNWMAMVVLKNQKEVLNFEEAILALSAGDSRYPLWIKIERTEKYNVTLNFSTRFRNIKNCKNQETGHPPFEITKDDPNKFELIQSLNDSEYFKYCDNTLSKNSTTNCLIENINLYGQIYSSYRDDIKFNNVPKCYRVYRCDQESLSEIGGMNWILERINFTFEKLNVPLKWDNIEDDYDEKTNKWFWKIKLNNKDYKLLNDGYNSWHVFAREFFKMINDQLESFNSKEKVYILSKGNDGMIAFLTEEIANKLTASKKLKETWVPLLPQEWFEKINAESLSITHDDDRITPES